MPGSTDIKTCPKCGALITPQLARCRQCGTYLHGTSVEGFLVSLLPANLKSSPATGVLILLILGLHALFVVLAGVGSIAAFSGYTLVQLGATSGVTLLLGEWWRLLTYQFVHHDLLHLAFNVWALVHAGHAVEAIYDAKKMFLAYLLAGAVGGAVSFLYYVYMRGGGHVVFVSGGASGAVCGLVGAALIGARRLGPDGRDLWNDMLRWSLFLVIWGFAMPGINNAAHGGGFLAGAALAYLIPVGQTKTVARQRMLSVLALVALGGVLAAFGWHFYRVQGQPISLKQDAQPRSLLFFNLHKGVDRDSSSQQAMLEECTRPIAKRGKLLVTQDDDWKIRALQDPEYRKSGKWRWKILQMMDTALFGRALIGVRVTQEMVSRCEAAFTANPDYRISYEALAAMLHHRGESARARRLEKLVERIFARGD
ncbi:MAG: rhomboid family intramembrane serine protease [Polyangia bacterium]|jgi:rhomboid protease GluP|nr:rhomboid family intramembrane serine protease [Polyangia bacterium]